MTSNLTTQQITKVLQNRGGEEFSNPTAGSVTSNLTLTILPPYTINEHLSNFVSRWISPISGLWTFLAGVGAVIAPLIIAAYHKKHRLINKDQK